MIDTPPAVQPIDLVTLALSRLPQQYRGSGTDSRPQTALRIVLAPLVNLQTVMLDVIAQRSVDNAVGAQLTALGKLVGRTGRHPDDEIERRYTAAQISVNKSDGLIEDILTVARLVIGSSGGVVLDNTGAAAYVLRVEGATVSTDVADVLAQLVGKATSGGVRAIIGYTTGPVASQMRWGTGTWGQNWSRARNTEQ